MTVNAAREIQAALDEQILKDLKRWLFEALIRSIDSANRAIEELS
jgi:hypothetical protein